MEVLVIVEKWLSKMCEKSLENLRNKRGVTLIQIFFVIIILIVLMVVFSDMNLIRKVTGGNETVAWSNDLTTLTNSILTNDIVELTYGTTITDGADYIRTVSAPPVSAYDITGEYIIDSLVQLNYGTTSLVAVDDTGYLVETHHTPPSTMAKVPTTSYSGSGGIAPFINLAIPKVEEALFMSLLGGSETEFGKYFEENNDLETIMQINPALTTAGKQLNSLLAIVFDRGETKYGNITLPTSWVSLNLMDTLAMKDILGISNRFLDEDKYRLYWVSSIATENEAIDLVKSNYMVAMNAQTEEEFRKLYREMSERILLDTVIVMPNNRNDMVYTESSDFEYYKFTAKD